MTRWTMLLLSAALLLPALTASAGELDDQQRTDFLEAARRIDELRAQTRRFWQVADKEGLSRAKAERYRDALRDAYRETHRQHDRFALSLSAAQQDTVGVYLRRIERVRTRVRRRLGQLDALVAENEPFARRIGERTEEIADELKNWQKQYRKISQHLHEPL